MRKRLKKWNSGIFIFKIPHLFTELKRIKSNNASNEYYLTDVIELIGKENAPVQAEKIRRFFRSNRNQYHKSIK